MNRNLVLKKHLSFSILFKGLGMLLMYITIPLLLDFLGDIHYGVWVTIFSIINWFYYFDVGIGNGLKNKLTESYAKKEFEKSSEYISTAFISALIISGVIFLCGIFLIYNFNIGDLLNVSLEETYLKKLFLIVLGLLSISFVLNLYKQLFYSIQKAALVQLSIFIFQLFILCLVIVIKLFYKDSLILVALIYGFTSVIVGLVFNIVFFIQNKSLFISLRNFKTGRIKEIMGIGLDFFVIQLCLIFILTTDNLIIANLIGPDQVTVYDSVFKIFQVFLVGNTLILTPFWTMYTDAYVKKDFDWIKRTLKRMNFYFLLLLIALFSVVYFFDFIIYTWLGKDLNYTKTLIWLMAVFVIVRAYGDIYIYFINGIGKIRLQKILFIIGALINVPLSIVLVKHFQLGIEGVMLATLTSVASFAILMPLQAYSLIRKSINNAAK